MSGGGGYGPSTGSSSYPGNSLGNGFGGGGGGGFGGGGFNGGGYGGGNGYGGGQSPYGNNGYGNNGYGNNGYGNGGGYGGGYGGSANCTPQTSGYSQQAMTAGPLGVPTTTATTTPATTAANADQTGSYLSPSSAAAKPVGPRVVPNPISNELFVQGTPQEWEQIRHLVDQLDVAPRQVLIDAKIYEVDLTGAFALGVESSLQPKGTGITQLLGTAGSAGLNLTAGVLVGQTRQLLAALTASELTTKSRVLSAPSIIATDSIPASITVGSSVPTLSSEAVSGVTVGGTSQFTNTISNTSTGIGLTILARVNPSGVVTMVINQDVTAPIANPLASSGAAGSGIDSPSFSQRNVSTQVTVEDGDTIAIGGIMNETTTETSAGIPFLHRLPYIGAFFGLKTSSKQKTELIIFLTPRVIYDTTEITDATDELKQKVRGLRKLMQNE